MIHARPELLFLDFILFPPVRKEYGTVFFQYSLLLRISSVRVSEEKTASSTYVSFGT